MKRVAILLTSFVIMSGCGGDNNKLPSDNGDNNNSSSDKLYEITSSNYDRATSTIMAAVDDLPLDPQTFQTVTEEGCINGSYTQKDIENGVDYKFSNCKLTSGYILNGEAIYKSDDTLSFGKDGFKVNRNGNESYNLINGSIKFKNDGKLLRINNLEYKITIKDNLHYIKVKNLNYNLNSNKEATYLTSSDVIDNKWVDTKVQVFGNKHENSIINIKGENNSSIKIEITEENSYDNYKIFLNNKEILKDKSNSEKEKAIDKRREYFLN